MTEIQHIVLHRTLLLFKTHTVQFEKQKLEKLWICKTVSVEGQTNIQGFTYSLWLLSYHLQFKDMIRKAIHFVISELAKTCSVIQDTQIGVLEVLHSYALTQTNPCQHFSSHLQPAPPSICHSTCTGTPFLFLHLPAKDYLYFTRGRTGSDPYYSFHAYLTEQNKSKRRLKKTPKLLVLVSPGKSKLQISCASNQHSDFHEQQHASLW